MTVLDWLERRCARFAVPGLVRYVVALNALVFILTQLAPGYSEMLELNRAAIWRGEVWRLVSWIFLPQTTNYFWIFFYLLFTWWLGDLLEQTWGTFRLNAYYGLGMALCIASALLFGASGGNLFLNLSLFLAVATLAPDLEILLFFVIPVRIKWVALFSLIFPVLMLLFGSLAQKMVIVMCLGNYLVFFGGGFLRALRGKASAGKRRLVIRAADAAPAETLHRCAVCGATEASHPDAEFRVSANGFEYCTRHLPARGKE